LIYNCNDFVADIARFVGLQTPSTKTFPKEFITGLRELNEDDSASRSRRSPAGVTAVVAVKYVPRDRERSAPTRLQAACRPALVAAVCVIVDGFQSQLPRRMSERRRSPVWN